MKVSIAVIKLVLRTNKLLADGSHPIMLRVSFNGMKEKSTGYSCQVKYWDKRQECIKKGYPNFVMVNAELRKMKDEAIRRRDEYIASDEVYTPAMILEKREIKNVVRNDLKGLIESYIREKGVKSRTVEHCNYYSYRHSVVMMEIQKPNCNFLALAQMIGKSSRTLYQYISELTNDEDLV